MPYRPSLSTALTFTAALMLIGLPSVSNAHNNPCEHTHVNYFRVHCNPDFAKCTSGGKEGRCITQKTPGLIDTWDCNCVVSDAGDGSPKEHDEILSGRCDEQKQEKKQMKMMEKESQ